MGLSLKTLLEEHEICDFHQDLINRHLSLLLEKHAPTYEHSLRVAVKAVQIARMFGTRGSDLQALFCAAVMHDIGKIRVDTALLTKQSGWTREDAAAMDLHVQFGWEMLREAGDCCALIVAILARHHRYGKRSYPLELPALAGDLVPCLPVIEWLARVVALADTHDALMTRRDRAGHRLSPYGRYTMYLEENPGQEWLIMELKAKRILEFEYQDGWGAPRTPGAPFLYCLARQLLIE
jgi:putative nucleotidyltransferase with HDIG domain